MKLTDFALIFIGITLPIIIIVYVNVSFTIKAEEQEIYYKRIINIALKDASDQMKEVESNDAEIDYGYSGIENNKISVNSQIAVDTFLDSLYNNFGIKGNKSAESYLQYFIPAIAVIDYNGVQVSSIEEFDSKIEHALKPKRYYSYTYYIYEDKSDSSKLTFTEDYNTAKNSLVSTHFIEFTMDDYITHRGIINSERTNVEIPVSSFYMSDSKNNTKLVTNNDSMSQNEKNILTTVVSKLQAKRKEIIINTIQNEMEYATNNNNYYASSAGIKYNFVFPTISVEEMESQIKNVGIMALIQGISMGNKYLNVRAYSTSKLTEITRYYLSVPVEGSKYGKNLYHKDTNCPEYKLFNETQLAILPSYLLTKQQAASVSALKGGKKDENSQFFYKNAVRVEGFYPCPICDP